MNVCVSVVLFLALLSTPVLATTYYVNPSTGLDSRTTTQAQSQTTPWQTLQKCASAAASGDTCLAMDGTYTDTDNNGPTVWIHGTYASNVTLRSLNKWGAVIKLNSTIADAAHNQANGHGFFISASGWTIQDFDITEGSESTTQGPNFGYGGFFVSSGAHNLTIRGNKIHDIARSVCSNSPIGNVGIGVDFNVNNILIEDNVIFRIGRKYNGESGCTKTPGDGGGNFNDHGMYVGNFTNMTIRRNLLYDDWRGYAMQFYHPNSVINGLKVYNNTIVGHGPVDAIGMIAAGQVILTYTMQNVEFKNNIFFDPPRPSGPAVGSVFTTFNLNTNPTITIQSNMTDSTDADLWNGTVPSGVTITSNTTGVNAATIFTNAALHDYTLALGSPAINAGTNVGLPFNGSAPDMGVYETIPTPTTLVASGNTVDVTIPMSLNTPILPATGQTTWTVKFSGVARTTVSAVRLTGSDSIVRITFDGAACQSSDTMTVDYAPGNVTDSADIGGTNQPLLAFSNLAVNTSACTGGGGGSPPPTGPIILYHLNDGSGTTVTDSSGNDNDGTTTGSPSWTTGAIDGGLQFTAAANDYVTIPYGSGVNPSTQSVTFCGFLLPDSANASNGLRFYMGAPLGTNQRAYVDTSNGTWVQGVQSSGTTGTTNNDFPVNAAYTLVCQVWDADTDTATLWVNAVKGTSAQSVKSYTSFTWAGNWTFGVSSGVSADESPNTTFDEFFVYGKALDQTEMTTLYESLVTPSPPPPSSTRKQKGHKFQKPYKGKVSFGGLEQTQGTTPIHARVDSSDIATFVPTTKGPFTFPAPYNTTGIRLTDDNDCTSAQDCVWYVGYSYWKNINNHVGQPELKIFLGFATSRGGVGPSLLTVNKSTNEVTNEGSLFPALSDTLNLTASIDEDLTGEGWYWSATDPDVIYMTQYDTTPKAGPIFYRYNVVSQTFTEVFDVTDNFGADRAAYQMHSSNDDTIHAGTLRVASTGADLGCFVYDENVPEWHFYAKTGGSTFDECNLDKSGRWTIMQETVSGSTETRFFDNTDESETSITGACGTLGHLDTGYNYAIGIDNNCPGETDPNALRYVLFPPGTAVGPTIFESYSWDVNPFNHVAHSNATDGALSSQLVCGSAASTETTPDDITCVRIGTPTKQLVIAPVMTDLTTGGGFDTYGRSPKGNIDITGRYFIWTTNLDGSSRLDAFLVKIPINNVEDVRAFNEDAHVIRGGYIDLTIQIDCTADDCPSFSPRIYRSIDGGATYAQVNDVCGAVCFRGASTDPDLVSEAAECCLTGMLTSVDGPTNFNSAAVPSITLSQDNSITVRYKLKVDSSVTPGQLIYFKVFDQNGNELEGGYTPALGAKLIVNDVQNGGGI